MKRFLAWINSHKVLSITLLMLIISLPIVIIHFLFKIHSNCYWIEAEWEAGDILGYFGNVLSLSGTVLFGYIAVVQSDRANKLSNELLEVEKNRRKPCLEIVSNQLYNIYLDEDMKNQLENIEVNDMRMDILYTKNPRTGITTDSALIKLEVLNSGFSNIQKMYLKDINFYLYVCDPFENKKIALMMSDTSLKINEQKTLYLYIKREIEDKTDLANRWYQENIDKLMPHMEFKFELHTNTGETYLETIKCSSGWDIDMQKSDHSTTRSIGVLDIKVQ